MLIIQDILQIHTALNPVIKPGICRAHSYSIRVGEKNHLWKEQWLTFWKMLSLASFTLEGIWLQSHWNLISANCLHCLAQQRKVFLSQLEPDTHEGEMTVQHLIQAPHYTTVNNAKSWSPRLPVAWLTCICARSQLKIHGKNFTFRNLYRKPEWRRELQQFTQWRYEYLGSHT